MDTRQAVRRAASLLGLVGAIASGSAGDARAQSSVTLSAGGTRAHTTDANPIGTSEAGSASGSFALRKGLSLALSFSGSRTTPVDPAPGSRWGNSGASVVQAGGGLSWSPSDHVTLGAIAGLSPMSHSTIGTRILVGASSAEAEIGLASKSRTYGGSLELATAGDSALEHDLSFGVSMQNLSVEQSIDQLSTTGITGGTTTLGEHCKQSHSAACRSVTTSLDTQSQTQMRSLAVRDYTASVSYTVTIAGSTDLAVELDHHSYAGDDPNAIGYFGQVTIGRTTTKTNPGQGRGRSGKTAAAATQLSSLALAGAVPLGPTNTSLSLSAARGFGHLKLGVVGGYENYVDDVSVTESLGMLASYDVSTGWNLSLGVTVARGTDEGGTSVPSKGATIALRHSY